ncbi:MAG: class I SAM-dependent methyltransferase, partial [Planctomycetales bacterium]
MTDLLTKSYDEIPYPSVPFVQSHPDRLATIATLYGMDPAPPSPESCRVLELGCAQGDNLIPLAMGTPRGEFVGIDLSPRQIADGQAVVAELGVENVRLEEMNLMDLDASWGEFDYILAHGVFSWVPDDVREGMLKLCRERLKPNGIAYISYNTLPGWRLRGAVRDMLRFHTRNVEGSRRQLTEGQAALDFFAEGIPEDQGLYRFIFQNVREDARDPEVESHLYHDFMEEFNQPFYFQEFIGRAARHDLQFLGEADASDSQPQRFNDQVQQMLASLDESYHLREQY